MQKILSTIGGRRYLMLGGSTVCVVNHEAHEDGGLGLSDLVV